MLVVVVFIQKINLRLGKGMTVGLHGVKILCMNSGNPILKHSNGCIQTEMIFKDLQHFICENILWQDKKYQFGISLAFYLIFSHIGITFSYYRLSYSSKYRTISIYFSTLIKNKRFVILVLTYKGIALHDSCWKRIAKFSRI